MDIRSTVIRVIGEAMDNRDSQLLAEIEDESVLLEIGLDSLGYAIVVTMLDEELGYDPFFIMEEPVYPTTLKEFVDIYEKYQDIDIS